MSGLNSLWDFVSGLPRDLFGDRVDSGWGIALSIYVSVITVSFVIGGYRSVHELGKALDIRFNKEKLDHYNTHRPDGTAPREVDWYRARKQQVRSLRFTLPFGGLVLVTLWWWVRDSFTLKSYFQLTACWLIAFLFVRVWWIATVVWTERKLAKKQPRVTPLKSGGRLLGSVSVPWAMRHYLNWGLQKSTIKRPPYIGLLKPLNPVVKLFGLRWMQIRLVQPLLTCAFFAWLWPLTTVIAAFHLTHEFDKKAVPLKPSWASRSAEEPAYDSGAIPDTPGDAAAASS